MGSGENPDHSNTLADAGIPIRDSELLLNRAGLAGPKCSVIRDEDAGQLFLQFGSGATALWDANRYNETEGANPRYTFGEIRVDGTGGHPTMDNEANIRVKKLGEPAWNLEYTRENRNFVGDCVYALQRHFVDCMLSGREFRIERPGLSEDA